MSDFTWKIEVDEATAPEWSAMLDQFDDANIYQTAAYGEVRWGKGNLSRLVLRKGGEVAAMAQFRIIRPTPLGFGMAYLRWGPLWERNGLPVDLEIARRFAHAIDEEYLRRRKLFVRILPNAFVGSPRAAAFQSAFSSFGEEADHSAEMYRTYVLDLSPSLERLRGQLDKKWRNQLNRSEKNNLTVTSGRGIEHYRAFCEIYRQMHTRKGFATTVDIDEFGRMQAVLPESQRLQVLICEENGIPVAGLVASVIGQWAIYLLGATSNTGLNAKGAYLLQWTLISSLKERGIQSYDLGGIDPEGNPGVNHFKKGLSGSDTTQINHLTASGSAVSSWMVGAGLLLQRMLRSSSKPATSTLLAQPSAKG